MSGRCGCRMAVKTTTEYPPSRHLHNFLRVRTPPLPFAHPPRPTQPMPGFCCRAHAATAPPWRTRRTMQLHGAARDLFSVGFSVFPCFFPQRAPTSRTHTPHAPYSPHTVLMARFLLLVLALSALALSSAPLPRGHQKAGEDACYHHCRREGECPGTVGNCNVGSACCEWSEEQRKKAIKGWQKEKAKQ